MKLYMTDLTDQNKQIEELNNDMIIASGYDKLKFVNPNAGYGGDLGFDTWLDLWNKPTQNNEISETVQANATYPVAITKVGNDVTFTYDAAIAPSGLSVGYHVTISNAEDAGNDIVLEPVTAKTATSFTIVNAAGVVNADDEAITIEIYDYSAGTLDPAKWYSIAVVPVDKEQVYGTSYQSGTPTLGSDPVQTSTGVIRYNIPINEQKTVVEGGYATSYTPNVITDTSKDFDVDALIGYRVTNNATQETAEITDNDATTITLDADLSFSATDGYTIYTPKANRRAIYAAELTSDSLSGASYTFVANIEDNTTTTYDLTSYALGGSGLGFVNVPPDAYSAIHVADNKVFGGGGIVEGRGTVSLQNTPELIQATSTYPVAITNTDDLTRFTFDVSLAPTHLYVGSYITTVSAEDSENDIEDARVIRIGTNWFEIDSEDAVANADDEAISITVIPNAIVGNTSGDDQTYFSAGMIAGTIALTGYEGNSVTFIDPINQVLTFTEKYEGASIIDSEFSITTDHDLWWSDVGNPNIWRTENSVPIPDRIVGISSVYGLLLVFCSRSIWKLPLNNLYQTPTRVSGEIFFDAPHSIVETPDGIMFYDGSGFSVTDGQRIISVTQYKATDYLRRINPDMSYNIRGVYDKVNQRVEYSFAYGNDISNNYGMLVTLGSFNCYPVSRQDANAMWIDEDDSGRLIVSHGTSGRHTTTGNGVIWNHLYSKEMDGDLGDGSYLGTITAVDIVDNEITFTTDSAVEFVSGDNMTYYPILSGDYVPMIIDTITEDSTDPYTYTVTYGDDWLDTDFAVGDYLVLGAIPFDYGIKWEDFSSPQYKHKVRQLHIDVTDFEGTLFVDHYLDLNEDASVERDTFTVTSDQTKIIAPFKKGSGYFYGFRLRGFSKTRCNILSFVIMFETEA